MKKNKNIEVTQSQEKLPYSELFKKPIVSITMDGFLEKVFRKSEASLFSPLFLGGEGGFEEFDSLRLNHFDEDNIYLSDEAMPVDKSDLLFLHPNLNTKLIAYAQEVYESMQKPCYVIVLGNDNFNLSGNDYCQKHISETGIPIDLYIQGNPPSPKDILNAVLNLRHAILTGKSL
ncbi:MAG: NADH:ubiquinone oxidoreductase subunit B-like Fe-S oxidoreductase [Thermoproteota archaeon]|jgi:NADH:ubiquinone oxidoreductase subunit B-like Fe-S oxidoreductase